MSNRFSSYNPKIPARLVSCLNDSGARYEILHEPSGSSSNIPGPEALAGLIGTAVVSNPAVIKTTTQLQEAFPENGRIYIAIVISGIAILLMILAEMKFFGT